MEIICILLEQFDLLSTDNLALDLHDVCVVVAPDPKIQVSPVLELLGSKHEFGVSHVLVIFALLCLLHVLVEVEYYFGVSRENAEVYHQFLFVKLDAFV